MMGREKDVNRGATVFVLTIVMLGVVLIHFAGPRSGQQS